MMQKGSFSQTEGRRDRFSIYSDMLTCAIGGTRKTEIMRRVGLSSLQLYKYMDALTRFGLLDVRILKKIVPVEDVKWAGTDENEWRYKPIS